MFSVRAVITGDKVSFLEEVKLTTSRQVIITFLEDDISTKQVQYFAEQGKAFDFLNDPAEDVYGDSDLKKKYE
jgi:hypothetical protein